MYSNCPLPTTVGGATHQRQSVAHELSPAQQVQSILLFFGRFLKVQNSGFGRRVLLCKVGTPRRGQEQMLPNPSHASKGFRPIVCLVVRGAGRESNTPGFTKGTCSSFDPTYKYGSLQVPGGALAEEAERCAPLRAACARVGVPSAAASVQGVSPHPHGQGSPPGLQGQAGMTN